MFEARYVGNHVVGAYREFDVNQVNIKHRGFLQDFIRAQNNGNLAQARNRRVQPRLQRLHSRQPAADGVSADLGFAAGC